GEPTNAFRTSVNDPMARAVIASLARTFGQPPVQLRTLGGTVPIAPFIDALGFPALVMPIVNFDNNQHEENENLRLGSLFDGIVKACDPSLIMFGLPGSPLLDAGRAEGLRVAAEGFADRSYEPDGSLTPRSRPGAVIHDVDAVVARAVRMVCDGVVLTADGRAIALQVQTICVHGDTPGAAE